MRLYKVKVISATEEIKVEADYYSTYNNLYQFAIFVGRSDTLPVATFPSQEVVRVTSVELNN